VINGITGVARGDKTTEHTEHTEEGINHKKTSPPAPLLKGEGRITIENSLDF
jgi:hypothetical protein